MRIALDAMGGECAPADTVAGAIAAAKDYNIDIMLVGRRAVIEPELKRHRYDLPIIDASQVVELGDNPTEVMRDKRDSSIAVGIGLVKSGEADAFVSAGNTGAVMTAATLLLKRIEGIERPALSILVSMPWHSILILDVGANVNCKPGYLVQFAQMGSVYMERVFGIENPRVGLLSNGEEEGKGNTLVHETHQLLKGAGLNFVGNVEGNHLPNSSADVIVTDGFTGNVVIKIGEAVGEMAVRSIKLAIAQKPHLKVLALMIKPAIRSAFNFVDYTEYGGAPLLGVNGNVIISHGRSNARAIKNALLIAKRAAEQDLVEAIRKGVN